MPLPAPSERADARRRRKTLGVPLAARIQASAQTTRPWRYSPKTRCATPCDAEPPAVAHWMDARPYRAVVDALIVELAVTTFVTLVR